MSREFKARLSAPDKDNKYYLRRSAGGYSYCIEGSPEYCEGSALANCVGYAWGRQAELEENPKCTIGVPESRLKRDNFAPRSAMAWMLSVNGRKTGELPKLGAVAVWKHRSKNTGHVAVVEQVNPDGSWLSSESAYGGHAFRNKKYNKDSDINNYRFLGFIYCLVDFEEAKPEPKPEPVSELKVGDKVQIVATGRATSYGEGSKAGGIGWIRYVKKIYKGRSYPYQVGNSTGTTGFYKRDALKKI